MKRREFLKKLGCLAAVPILPKLLFGKKAEFSDEEMLKKMPVHIINKDQVESFKFKGRYCWSYADWKFFCGSQVQ